MRIYVFWLQKEKTALRKTNEKISRKELRDSFYVTADRFIKNDLVKVIFECNEFCVCNISDYFYTVVPFSFQFKGNEIGLLITQKMAKDLASTGVFNLVKYGDGKSKRVKGQFFRFNDANFKAFTAFKEKTANGPSRQIDKDWEEQVMRQGGLLKDETVSCE